MHLEEHTVSMRKQLGERIRRRRMKLGMTQQELADACGFSEEHCKQVEYGNKALSIYTLRSVATALNVSTDYLLYGRTASTLQQNILCKLDGLSPDQLIQLDRVIEDIVSMLPR